MKNSRKGRGIIARGLASDLTENGKYNFHVRLYVTRKGREYAEQFRATSQNDPHVRALVYICSESGDNGVTLNVTRNNLASNAAAKMVDADFWTGYFIPRLDLLIKDAICLELIEERQDTTITSDDPTDC